MRIAFVELANFRKLLSVRVDFGDELTLFVGANNSGKTSAMLALRRFLLEQGKKFKPHDLTLCHWTAINEIGRSWEASASRGESPELPANEWAPLLPALDIWLAVENDELHHVSSLIPTLDWSGGLLGVRLRLEPKDPGALFQEYTTAVRDAEAVKAAAEEDARAAGDEDRRRKLSLWPKDLIDFLGRRMSQHLTLRAYLLDPEKLADPEGGQARPQVLVDGAQALEGDPLAGLIRIHEINAQRGLGDSDGADPQDGEARRRESRRLSDQLQAYYRTHLDPEKRLEAKDLDALQAIEAAQDTFDDRLRKTFAAALKEVEGLGYPGVTDPKLRIATKLHAMDGLNHEAAVSFEIDVSGATGGAMPVLRLPEGSNGLGYQNLISMVFRLMSFRDAWMRVGKAEVGLKETAVEPLHLVLVEEPEAHLHAQVQQVFIRKAYEVLRDHPDLGDNPRLCTQLVVSTHSSHVAHETDFSNLRYFRRLPAGMNAPVPVSEVINLSAVFGEGDATDRFVSRYIRAQHADLFFADAAILVEGAAEKMLVPHFIRARHGFLNQCYISLLEIGGSHAHRLKPLIEKLGLLTLIITDLDAGAEATGAAEPPAYGKKQRTNNTTLRKWVPELSTVDELLAAEDSAKIRERDQLFAVRAAYQTAVEARLPGKADFQQALPNTFEDALVFENLDLFSQLGGTGLVRKFKGAINDAPDVATLGAKMLDDLKTGSKAEFALDVLGLRRRPFESLKVPGYISEGLIWLEERLRKRKEDVVPEQAAEADAG